MGWAESWSEVGGVRSLLNLIRRDILLVQDRWGKTKEVGLAVVSYTGIVSSYWW